MAEIQEGIQVLFDNIEASDATSDETATTERSNIRDYHQEQYESYVPPHKRGHNLQQDKFVNQKRNNTDDKEEGVDHNKYQKLMLPVPFALGRDKLSALKKDFPGVFFHCKDNGNHDHQFSHVVTMVGTRLMQRRIRPGSKVLDVYGNPNACDRFNTSQLNATEPKFMKALVNRVAPTDFIREVNKWGPFFDEENGVERYHRGSLMSVVRSGEINQYDVLHLVHTLYYIPFEELSAALHAPGKRVAYALIHRHAADKGSLNDGEQTYEKKWVGGRRLLKQVNTSTGSSYVHPDLSTLLFSQNKVWMPDQQLETVHRAGHSPTQGMTWECHIVNDETWVVEFVPYTETEIDGVEDFAALWDDDECLFDSDPLSTPTESSNESIQSNSACVTIPTDDGKFVVLDIPCKELFSHLRMRCSGKDRTPKLLEEMISTANHLVNPSTMFGDKVGMRCPPDKIYDVAVAAWLVDIVKENNVSKSVSLLKPLLNRHASNMKLGPKYKDLCLRDLMSLMRLSLQTVKDVNHVVRAKDPLDAGILHLQGYLQ